MMAILGKNLTMVFGRGRLRCVTTSQRFADTPPYWIRKARETSDINMEALSKNLIAQHKATAKHTKSRALSSLWPPSFCAYAEQGRGRDDRQRPAACAGASLSQFMPAIPVKN
ncbi:hypothetical protein HW555_001428 [Spodoptera exigua]|uniref:Uncharacterized protein n=1 Tax=Spodoptera exigua TaxID=7107 RepID=A0A835GS65_SPOEX|nr:hypothetical protein HW555_001428 [Spodoptera exigua]